MKHLSVNRLRRRPKGRQFPAPDYATGVTIRYAFPDDMAALRSLAALDSQPLPAGRLLLAEIAGEPWAAVSIESTPVAVADPFRPTVELVALLSGRARRLADPTGTPRRRWRSRMAPGRGALGIRPAERSGEAH
ncbi:MAG TPA: hypothetical protein VGL51_07755 [Solirubrobacteraceae bacterium]